MSFFEVRIEFLEVLTHFLETTHFSVFWPFVGFPLEDHQKMKKWLISSGLAT
jgi:predicted metal-dependent hydrolase